MQRLNYGLFASMKKQTNVTMLRMTDALRSSVEKYRKKLERETGLQIGFSTALRKLVETGLVQEGVK